MVESKFMLPEGDRTPAGFVLTGISIFERIKRPLRRLLYPIYGYGLDIWIRKQGYARLGLEADYWLWGQRGNDYEAHRRRINRIVPIRSKEILIAGCGTGRDVMSWLSYEPQRLTGIEYFNYEYAWKTLQADVRRSHPQVELSFHQADLACMKQIADASIDIVGSDAVFEHLQNLPSVLREFHRILKPNGVLYASFGPLWYSWGGDHFSGHDGDILTGYNHLLLEPEAYEAYLREVEQNGHSEHDGRTWIQRDLFSRLRPAEYLMALEEVGFERREVRAIIEPRAVQCLKQYPTISEELLAKHDLLDLVITGMTVIYQKTLCHERRLSG